MLLRLLGRGNEHAVWRYEGHEPALKCCVLRVRHTGGAHTPCTALPALSAMLHPFVHAPLATLRLADGIAAQLCESAAHSGNPPTHVAKSVVESMLSALDGSRPSESWCASSMVACIELDHTRVYSGVGGICVELKPKAAVLPPNAPLDAVTPRRCRFCLYADLKTQRKEKVASASESASASAPSSSSPLPPSPMDMYCPLDFYSCEPVRSARAVSALLRHPKNNLRVMDVASGEVLYGGPSTPLGGPDQRLPDGFSLATIEAIVLAVLAEQSTHTLLATLLRAQRRALIGSARAVDVYLRGVRLAGSEEGLCDLIRAHQSSCYCAGATCACATVGEAAGAPSLAECVALLSEWLLGLAASDVSLMLSVCLAPPPSQATTPGISSSDTSSPRRITIPWGGVPGGAAASFYYRLAVVDVSAKPPQKVSAHAELDVAIVQHWSHPGTPPRTPLHSCEPLTLRTASLARITGFGGATLIIAFGTRGDVLPMVALARSSGLARPVIFATHECYRDLVLCAANNEPSDGGVAALQAHPHWLHFVGVASDPLRPNDHPARADKATNVEVEYAPIITALHALTTCIDLVVFNLFSLGGWHIAEALDARSTVVSPCIVPYDHPSTFPEAFAAQHAALHAALRDAPEGRVSWADVAMWMWPLWDVERWGVWREKVLGLGPTPLSGVRAANRLPTTTPLLYTISPSLVPRPAFWPSSVHAIGFLVGAESSSQADQRCLQSAPATHGLVTGATKPLYMGFGSSSPLLLQGQSVALPETLACAALEVARVKHCGLILHCCGCEDLCSRWYEVLLQAGCDPISGDTNSPSGERELLLPQYKHASHLAVSVALVRGELPLEWVFSRCVAAAHHGGAGTSHTAIRAGVPQLILPLIFDQFATAERVEHAGVGMRLRRAALDAAGSGAATSELLRALTAVLEPEAMAHVDSMRRALGAENGVVAARDIMASAPPSSSPSTEGHITTEASSPSPEGHIMTKAVSSSMGPILAAARAWKRARDDEADESADGTVPEGNARSSLVPLPNGTSVWCHSPSEAHHIYDEIYSHQSYLPPASGVQLPLDDGDDAPQQCTIVDVGANIGLFTLWAAQRVPSAHVLAVEPAAPTAALLARNVREHGLEGRVTTTQIALGACAGRAQLRWYANMPGNSTFFPRDKEAEGERCFRPERRAAMLDAGTTFECEVATLSHVLATCLGPDEHVALLKVDVEGSEVDVLEGVEDADWPRLRQVVVETHGAQRRVAVASILARHYEVVGDVEDEELARCGLERSVTYARLPRSSVGRAVE